MTDLEQLQEWLIRDRKELEERQAIYEANQNEFKKGTALKTKIALASHQAAKAQIERRKENYSILLEEIVRIEKIED